jgi:hypothetical protein
MPTYMQVRSLSIFRLIAPRAKLDIRVGTIRMDFDNTQRKAGFPILQLDVDPARELRSDDCVPCGWAMRW